MTVEQCVVRQFGNVCHSTHHTLRKIVPRGMSETWGGAMDLNRYTEARHLHVFMMGLSCVQNATAAFLHKYHIAAIVYPTDLKLEHKARWSMSVRYRPINETSRRILIFIISPNGEPMRFAPHIYNSIYEGNAADCLKTSGNGIIGGRTFAHGVLFNVGAMHGSRKIRLQTVAIYPIYVMFRHSTILSRSVRLNIANRTAGIDVG